MMKGVNDEYFCSNTGTKVAVPSVPKAAVSYDIFSIPFLLTNQVYDHTGNPGKQNNIQKIEKKAFP